MKKFIMLLVLGILVVLPIKVRGFAIDITNDKTSKTRCEESELCEDGDYCVSNCVIYIKDNTDGIVDPITLVIRPKLSTTEVSDITAADGFSFSGSASAAVFTPTSPVGVTDKEFKIASFKLTYPVGTDCSWSVGFTEEEIVEVPKPTPNQPSTGVSLPVAILIGGAALAVITYTMTNKNKKMYKI